MGNQILTNKKMKFAYTLVLILAIAMSNRAQSVQPTHLGACISEVRTVAEHVINTLDGVVLQDIVKAMGEAVQVATEAAKVKDVCSQFGRDDFLMWLDQHTTPGQKVCVSSIMSMLLELPNLKKALANPDLKWQDKLKAFSPIVEASEKVAEGCIPEA